MTPQSKPGAYKDVQSERDLVSSCPRLSGRGPTLRDRDRKRRFVNGGPALAGDRYTSTGRRAYFYGIGGSPIDAQVNFVHHRNVEPFPTSGGGFLYFNHRTFGGTQFNFAAQLGGGAQLFTSSRRTAIGLGYKYHHISNENLGNHNPELESHMLFAGLSLFRGMMFSNSHLCLHFLECEAMSELPSTLSTLSTPARAITRRNIQRVADFSVWHLHCSSCEAQRGYS